MGEVVQEYIDDPRARVDVKERLGRAARRIRSAASPPPPVCRLLCLSPPVSACYLATSERFGADIWQMYHP